MELFSTECKDIFKALAIAQGSFPPVPKSGFNPHFKSTFSNLEDIEKACRPALAANGLGFTQLVVDGETPLLITLLTHSSGQWIKSSIALKPASWEAQKVGAYITYMRRYALGALLGIVGCEDDDGNEDSKPHDHKVEEVAPKIVFINSSQLSQIHNSLRDRFTDDDDLHIAVQGLLDTLKVGRFEDIKSSDYKKAMQIITILSED